MNATILCVGKLREKWQQAGCEEYLKRLSRYGRYEIVAVDDARDPEKPVPALIRQAMEKEGAALMRQIRPNDCVVCLCVQADAPDSVRLSELTGEWARDGRRVVFVIGGSNGLSEEVLARADLQISFSPMTFSHGVFRIVLLEQLYRAFKIMNHETYHK